MSDHPRTPFRVPVLAYHHIDARIDGPWSVVPSEFERHLDWLAGEGVCGLGAVMDALEQGEPPPRGVVITFDDGYQSLLEFAFPALRERALPATVFLITGSTGAWDDWNARATTRSRHLSWEEAGALANEGHEIGSHSRTHHALEKFDRDRIKAELHGSADDIQLALGRPVRALAYPHGSFNETVAGIAKKRYCCGFTSGSKGERDWRAAPLAIHRITVVPEWPLDELTRRVELYRDGR